MKEYIKSEVYTQISLVQRTARIMNTEKTEPWLKATDVYFRIVKIDFYLFFFFTSPDLQLFGKIKLV